MEQIQLRGRIGGVAAATRALTGLLAIGACVPAGIVSGASAQSAEHAPVAGATEAEATAMTSPAADMPLTTFIWNTSGSLLSRIPQGDIPDGCGAEYETCGPYSQPPPVSIGNLSFGNRSFAIGDGIARLLTRAVYDVGGTDFRAITLSTNPGPGGGPEATCYTWDKVKRIFDPTNRYCGAASATGGWQDQWNYYRIGPALPLILTLTSATPQPVVGKPVEFYLTWNEGGGNIAPEAPQAPPGTMRLYDGDKQICVGSTYSFTRGSFTCPSWPIFPIPGDYPISLRYSGDVLHGPATADLTLKVDWQSAGPVVQAGGITNTSSGNSVQPFTGGANPATTTMRRIAVSAAAILGSQFLAVGNDGALYHQTAFDGQFSGFVQIGIAAEAAIDTFADGSAQIIVTRTDGTVYHRIRVMNGSWTGWGSLGITAQAVAMTAVGPSAHFIAVDPNGNAYYRIRNPNGSWSPRWEPIPHAFEEPVVEAAMAWDERSGGGGVQVALRTSDGLIFTGTRQGNGNWSSFTALPLPNNRLATALAMTGQIPRGANIELVIGSDDGNVYHRMGDGSFQVVGGAAIPSASLAIAGDPVIKTGSGVVYAIQPAN